MKLLIVLLFTLSLTAQDLAPRHIKNDRPKLFPTEEIDAKEYSRHIYMKLPLAQPMFHWVFTDKDKLLKGS